MPSLKNPKADLRKRYYRTFEVSLIVSLVLIVAAFKFSPLASKTESLKDDPQDVIKVEDIIKTVQKPDVPPPPKAPQIIAATIDDIPDDFVLPDIDNVEPVKLPDKPPVQSTVNILDEPFIEYPEELPSPVGGFNALLEKLYYTEIARRADIEGTVTIAALINKFGEVVEAKIVKGIGGGLDEIALDAVLNTKFHPGKQRGIPVNVNTKISVRFVLK
jgi:periplasmic protein TonB